ncbi:MAG: hypothetical protein OXH86_19330, partial [Acidimicrobiaceae bacterium]|nr:hypothetical protein [Acidimicrobiaceae bacterium]
PKPPRKRLTTRQGHPPPGTGVRVRRLRHERRNLTNRVQAVNTPGRDQNGIVTLQWLLIVVAVAGLATLAAVLIHRTTDHAARYLAEYDARLHTAELAAFDIQQAARAQQPSPGRADQANRHWQRRCHQLRILYNDALQATNELRQIRYKPGTAAPHGGWDPQAPPACNIIIRPR